MVYVQICRQRLDLCTIESENAAVAAAAQYNIGGIYGEIMQNTYFIYECDAIAGRIFTEQIVHLSWPQYSFFQMKERSSH